MQVAEIIERLKSIEGFKLTEHGMIRNNGVCPLCVIVNQDFGTSFKTDYVSASRRLGLTENEAWLIACAADFESKGNTPEGKAHNELRKKLLTACLKRKSLPVISFKDMT